MTICIIGHPYIKNGSNVFVWSDASTQSQNLYKPDRLILWVRGWRLTADLAITHAVAHFVNATH
jgi:hypothetical protein